MGRRRLHDRQTGTTTREPGIDGAQANAQSAAPAQRRRPLGGVSFLCQQSWRSTPTASRTCSCTIGSRADAARERRTVWHRPVAAASGKRLVPTAAGRPLSMAPSISTTQTTTDVRPRSADGAHHTREPGTRRHAGQRSSSGRSSAPMAAAGFGSLATNLVGDDTNGEPDVFSRSPDGHDDTRERRHWWRRPMAAAAVDVSLTAGWCSRRSPPTSCRTTRTAGPTCSYDRGDARATAVARRLPGARRRDGRSHPRAERCAVRLDGRVERRELADRDGRVGGTGFGSVE
jgi:hypothetical protein